MRPPLRCLLGCSVLVLGLAGCRDRADLAGDTVEVSLAARTIELEVVSCGLDDDVFVLGATSADAFVQLLVRSDEDGDVALDRSAVTIEIAREGILGAGSAELLQVDVGVPGAITSASIEGDRVSLLADLRPIDGSTNDDVDDARIEARCPAVEEFV